MLDGIVGRATERDDRGVRIRKRGTVFPHARRGSVVRRSSGTGLALDGVSSTPRIWKDAFGKPV